MGLFDLFNPKETKRGTREQDRLAKTHRNQLTKIHRKRLPRSQLSRDRRHVIKIRKPARTKQISPEPTDLDVQTDVDVMQSFSEEDRQLNEAEGTRSFRIRLYIMTILNNGSLLVFLNLEDVLVLFETSMLFQKFKSQGRWNFFWHWHVSYLLVTPGLARFAESLTFDHGLPNFHDYSRQAIKIKTGKDSSSTIKSITNHIRILLSERSRRERIHSELMKHVSTINCRHEDDQRDIGYHPCHMHECIKCKTSGVISDSAIASFTHNKFRRSYIVNYRQIHEKCCFLCNMNLYPRRFPSNKILTLESTQLDKDNDFTIYDKISGSISLSRLKRFADLIWDDSDDEDGW